MKTEKMKTTGRRVSMNAYFKTFLLLCCVVLAFLQTGCKEEKGVAVSLSAHDHYPKRQVLGVSINDDEGSASIGGIQCCIVLPKKWKPGLTAKLSWAVYLDDDPNEPRDPNTPKQPVEKSAIVEIPQYDKPRQVHVHIYPGEKARIVVSNYDFGSPFYPLPREEWAFGGEVDYIIIYRITHTPNYYDNHPKPPTEKDWEWAKQWGLTKDGKCTDPDYLEWEKGFHARIVEGRKRQREIEEQNQSNPENRSE
ncbi:MAG: DUF3304 domain-containing protein [Azoarcus sp.]|jgi:hypothetical protein|nr:DUF3304 domain-containing protein [Azoarcus sp.]